MKLSSIDFASHESYDGVSTTNIMPWPWWSDLSELLRRGGAGRICQL